MADVTTSCPAEVIKNYSNVFAQITKSIIGEIDQTDTEESEQTYGEEQSSEIVIAARGAL